MSRAIKSTQLFLQHNGAQTLFSIVKTLGQGGSCIAYEVTYEESDGIQHTGVLKEYCPAYLEEYGEFRDETGALQIPEAAAARFAAELQRFKEVYISINAYLVANPAAANYHPVQLGLYEGNHTLYTLVSCDYGTSYDKMRDDNLKSVLKMMLAVTKCVELYHQAGFLHLDIKPENIFILNEVTELVKLFDYDSLTSIEDVKARKVTAIPRPNTYYVPELDQSNLRAIGIPTDIFEIGAMLFLRVFGRAPTSLDMTYDAVYAFDQAALLKGVSPKVRFELEQLLRHTLQVSPRSRYQTTGELKRQLETLIDLADSKRPYLRNMPKWQPSANYVARKEEVAEIHRRLQTDGYVFIKGIGGLGKSELAKIYAKEYADLYHTVVFCKYTDALTGLVAALPIQGINADDYHDFDSLVYDKNQVLHDCDAHTLLIVDNFNVTYDKYLRDFLPAGNDRFKVIFTTRCTQAAEYYEEKTYPLPKLSPEICESLFLRRANLPADPAGKETLQEIIKTIDRNTLILVLLAAAVKRTQMTLAQVLEKLVNQELDAIRPSLFHEYDYDTEETDAYNKLLSHLYAVFSISALSGEEVEVLKAMTLVPMEGISQSELIGCCRASAVNEIVIQRLVAQSWLFENNGTHLSMHPTVSDLIANNRNVPQAQSYFNLAEALEEFCNPDYDSHISVILNRLSTAVQLDRRYKEETPDKAIVMKAKLGRLYANIYRPAKAREYLRESEELCLLTKLEYFLPYIYHFLGKVEKDFGTTTAAIAYYQKAVAYGKKITIRYYEIVAESMVAIADCYFQNQQSQQAFKQYKEALRFARLHRFNRLIANIALSLVEVCQALNLPGQEQKYANLHERYKEETKTNTADDRLLARMNEAIQDVDFEKLSLARTEYLEQKRRELGEDSPLYKDLANGQWVFSLYNGDKEGALRGVSEELAFVRETYGEKSMAMADKLIDIATMFPVINDFEYAEAAAKEAIAICEQQKEGSSYASFRARLALARCYIPQNKLDEARAIIVDMDFKAFQGTEALSDVISSAGLILCELSLGEEIEPLCLDLLKNKSADVFGRLNANLVMYNIYERRGDLETSERYLLGIRNALDEIHDDSVTKRFVIHYYRGRAKLLDRKGEYESAIDTLKEFLSLFEKEQKRDYTFYVVFVELGLYYVHAGDINSAKLAYVQAEKILDENHMAKEAYVGLYNNIAYQLMIVSNFEEANKYLEKIVEIKPDVVEPTAFFDATVCSNIAWAAMHRADFDYGIQLARKSLACYRKIGSTQTREYVTTLYNLSLMYGNKELYDEGIRCLKEGKDILKKHPDVVDWQTRAWLDGSYVFLTLMKGQAKDAFTYAERAMRDFSERFGVDERYACFLVELGHAFYRAQYMESLDFYQMACERLEGCHLKKSVLYARLLNFIGVYMVDLKDDHNEALRCFENAKALFEELGAEDDEMYALVLQNIKYAENLRKKRIDDAINDLVRTIKNAENDEE